MESYRALPADSTGPARWDPLPEWTARYDALNRRVEKSVGGETTVFYWDTDRLAAEIRPTGALRVYVYADALAMTPLLFVDYVNADAAPESGVVYGVFADHLGCPERIEDMDGQTVWAAVIAPYGAAQVTTGSEFSQPLRWPGHYYDAELGLQYNRFRTYAPGLGRYLEPDPLGRAGGLENVYAYTKNPLFRVDTHGLSECPVAKAAREKAEAENEEEGKPDEEGVEPKPISEMTPDEARDFCEQRAAELKQVFAKADPEVEKSVTLSVGVVEDAEGHQKVVVSTSKDSQELHPAVLDALQPGEEFRRTEPTIVRGTREPNEAYDPITAKQRADNGQWPDTRNNPKTTTPTLLKDPAGGAPTPYQKATNGDPPEGTIHHAEQRMDQGAADNGETVVAQAPTKPCCPGCQSKLGEGGLAKIPPDLRGN